MSLLGNSEVQLRTPSYHWQVPQLHEPNKSVLRQKGQNGAQQER